ncbi:MAG: hypothetical protein ABI559_04180 [Chloroflexota bacterium]
MILVFAAMQSEVRLALGWLRDYRESDIAGFPTIEAEGIVICQSGLGRRAIKASGAVIDKFPPDVVLSIGVAGGLKPALECGDIIVCETIDHELHRASGKIESVTCSPSLIEAALAAGRGFGLHVSPGTSLTLDEAAWTADAKAEHHAWKGHDIVEMESFWVGQAAAEAGAPYLAVRSISDAADHPLPKTGAMKDDGNFDPDALLAYVQEHPEAAPLIAAQAERAQPAFGNLAILLTGLLPPLVQHFNAAR